MKKLIWTDYGILKGIVKDDKPRLAIYSDGILALDSGVSEKFFYGGSKDSMKTLNPLLDLEAVLVAKKMTTGNPIFIDKDKITEIEVGAFIGGGKAVSIKTPLVRVISPVLNIIEIRDALAKIGLEDKITYFPQMVNLHLTGTADQNEANSKVTMLFVLAMVSIPLSIIFQNINSTISNILFILAGLSIIYAGYLGSLRMRKEIKKRS